MAQFLGQAYMVIIKISRVSPYLLNKVKILAYWNVGRGIFIGSGKRKTMENISISLYHFPTQLLPPLLFFSCLSSHLSSTFSGRVINWEFPPPFLFFCTHKIEWEGIKHTFRIEWFCGIIYRITHTIFFFGSRDFYIKRKTQLSFINFLFRSGIKIYFFQPYIRSILFMYVFFCLV